ncbi:methylenetetrahydrofolate reductase [Pseudothermotoga thermarum]|uniref:Methylenetetrahydrofolate reductase n=1 Tax=Pseudothermotoga thermarum DSM 5069 TaxID=688269 RepID=F7YXH5_9THEM|nr:methylenetetrahydrofolate reductase [Pseudothermotoga thermarum]AEH50616.1 Methylenetetrahydrofolate reductase (NAD(P)H) [Pseudothermotoga thermarum DSM 5069]
MKVVEKIKQKRILSIEVLPPSRGQNVEEIYQVIDNLLDFDIDFINVTRHAAEVTYVETPEGIVKVPKVKRPGTVGLTAALMKRYGIDVVPHVICYGMNKYQIEELLIDLQLIGVENVFVIRGEYENRNIQPDQSSYKYAVELVQQIARMNKGESVLPGEEGFKTDFCIGVAAYPEKHYEAPNLEEDLRHFKEKFEAGAQYAITQMVFDFEVYKRFIEMTKEMGINIPIIPGIKPIVSLKSIYQIPRKFFVTIPNDFVQKMQEAKTPKEEFLIGTKYMASLVEKLLSYGVPGIHIFTMGRGQSSRALLEAVYGKERRRD